jgi:hypothetical protein
MESHVRFDLFVQGAALHRRVASFEIRRPFGLGPLWAALGS